MTDTRTEGGRLFDRAVYLLVEFRKLGTTRKVATSAIDTRGADEDYVHVSKSILESDKLDAIGSYFSDIKALLKKRTTPSKIVRGGIYLLPNSYITEVDHVLSQAGPGLDALVDAFMAEYDEKRREAQVKLGPLFDPMDYPDAATVRRTFGIRHQILTVDAPGTLAEISADIYEREARKAAAQWEDAIDTCTTTLYTMFSEMLDHMVECLTPQEDGKPRRFHRSSVENFAEFCTSFPARNLGGNMDLESLVTRAGQILGGQPVGELKTRESVRTLARERLTAIKASLGAMTIERPARRFTEDE